MVIPKAKLGECCTNFDKLLGAPVICKGSVRHGRADQSKKNPCVFSLQEHRDLEEDFRS
jgi:hypothetical protein